MYWKDTLRVNIFKQYIYTVVYDSVSSTFWAVIFE